MKYNTNTVIELIDKYDYEGLKKAKEAVEIIINEYRLNIVHILNKKNKGKYDNILKNKEELLEFINHALVEQRYLDKELNLH